MGATAEGAGSSRQGRRSERVLGETRRQVRSDRRWGRRRGSLQILPRGKRARLPWEKKLDVTVLGETGTTMPNKLREIEHWWQSGGVLIMGFDMYP